MGPCLDAVRDQLGERRRHGATGDRRTCGVQFPHALSGRDPTLQTLAIQGMEAAGDLNAPRVEDGAPGDRPGAWEDRDLTAQTEDLPFFGAGWGHREGSDVRFAR